MFTSMWFTSGGLFLALILGIFALPLLIVLFMICLIVDGVILGIINLLEDDNKAQKEGEK